MSYQAAVNSHGSIRAAAKASGLPYSTFHGRLIKEQAVELPTFPAKHGPIDELLDARSREFKRKKAYLDASAWFPVTVHDNLPIGIMWFGDPHIDDDHCNIDLLREHVRYCVSEPGLYGANIGDTTNNWVGRLMRLFAKQDASQDTARRLAEWFMSGSGVPWLVWLIGNHDEWNDGAEILKRMNIHKRVPVMNWEARFEVIFKNKTAVRVHAAHDFPGSSIYNTLHGPTKTARFGGHADLYVCGHKHTPGTAWFPAESGRTPVLARARGYKWHDDHALVNGFSQYDCGAAILTIIDPTASQAGRVLAFPDVAQGVKVLKALRGGK